MIKSLLNLLDDNKTDYADTPNLGKLLLRTTTPFTNILDPIMAVNATQLLKTPKDIKNIVRSFQGKVTPLPGSVIICDLMDVVEHSGIYIGNNKIVHLSGSGRI